MSEIESGETNEKDPSQDELVANEKIGAGKKGLLKIAGAVGVAAVAPVAGVLVGAGLLAGKALASQDVKDKGLKEGWKSGLSGAFGDFVSEAKRAISETKEGWEGLDMKAKLKERREEGAAPAAEDKNTHGMK